MYTYAHTCFMHAYTYTGMRTHVRVLETMKDSALKMDFGMNPTSNGSRSKPLFSHYIKPYIVAFQNTQKILRDNLRFIRHSESKRVFYKTSSSQHFSD